MPFDSLKYKWAWQAQFLSYTLQIFTKCVSFEDAQMILVPYFAISYVFNFKKNAKAFQSILKQSLCRHTNNSTYDSAPNNFFFSFLIMRKIAP